MPAQPPTKTEILCFGDYNTRKSLDWAAVWLAKFVGGRSWIYDHVVTAQLKRSILNSDQFKTSPGLPKLVPDDAWICLMCKEDGKAVGECIIKVPPRTTSNTHSHPNTMHGEAVAMSKKTTTDN